MMDVALPNTCPTSSPRVAEFVSRVLERLKPLMSEAEIHNHVQEEDTPETTERTQAVKLLKTGQNAEIQREQQPNKSFFKCLLIFSEMNQQFPR